MNKQYTAGFRDALRLEARALEGMADKAECEITADAYRNAAAEIRRCAPTMLDICISERSAK